MTVSCPASRGRKSFTLVELLVVVFFLALLISILLPGLSNARRSAARIAMQSDIRAPDGGQLIQTVGPPTSQPPVALAMLKSFQASIGLTPRLSVGTNQPESIYEATFRASLEALPSTSQGRGESDVELPLPPQIISLGDLSVSVNGQPSDAMSLRGDKLVWHGPLSADAPAKLEVVYTAIGRGLYSLQIPPGKILDQFKIDLTAHGSDVRMLELSLQPTSLARSSTVTTYAWDYKRLMFGRPIALDVLGIAPVDRLGELAWLGPLSVIALGLVLGVVTRAYHVANFDRWMLLLVLGLFTGSYPLMYFAQEYVSVRLATILVGIAVLSLITTRVVSLMGPRLGLLGVTLPAAAIMTLTLAATTRPNLQGILLTVMALSLFAMGMLLAPRLQRTIVIPPTGPMPAAAM
jgi:hypothetical protein